MSEAKFKIGDRVKTSWAGPGAVTDVLYSKSKDQYTYEVGESDKIIGLFDEDEMELVPEKKEYSMTINIDIVQNVVIATLYEETEDSKSPLAKGHGHMIHEGELGIAQAASYACKRLYESLGGTLTKGGSWR